MSFMELKKSTSFDNNNKRQEGVVAAAAAAAIKPNAPVQDVTTNCVAASATTPMPNMSTILTTSLGLKKNRRFNDLNKNNTSSTNNTTTSTTNSTRSRNDRRKYKRKSIVKQYKGKRDPSKPITNVKLQHLNLINRGINENQHTNHLHQQIINQTTNELEVIDLDSSTTLSSRTALNKELDLPVINIPSSSSFATTSSSSTTTTPPSKATESMGSPVPLSQRALNRRIRRIGGSVGGGGCISLPSSSIQRHEKMHHRHKKQRKQLKESTLAQINKNFPCMNSLDRVLNWKISDEFLEVEEFSSCNNSHGKSSIELRVDYGGKSSAVAAAAAAAVTKATTISSTDSMITTTAGAGARHSQKVKKKIVYSSSSEDGGAAPVIDGNLLRIDRGGNLFKVPETPVLKLPVATQTLPTQTPPRRTPPLQTPSPITAAQPRRTASPKQRRNPPPRRTPSPRRTTSPRRTPLPRRTPSPRRTPPLTTTTTTTTPTIISLPEPVTLNEDTNLPGHNNHEPESKIDEEQQPSQSVNTNNNSSKEEFCKYLRIDINPQNHNDRYKNIDPMDQFKRRSLRVKVQQIAMNNMAKYIKEIEIEKKKCDELEQLSYNNLICNNGAIANGGGGGGGGGGSIGCCNLATCTNNCSGGGNGVGGDICSGNSGGVHGTGNNGTCLGNIRRSKKRYKLISAKKPSNKKKIDFMESSMYITAMLHQQQQEILLNNCRSHLLNTNSNTTISATVKKSSTTTKSLDGNFSIENKELKKNIATNLPIDNKNPSNKRRSTDSPVNVDQSDATVMLLSRKYRKKSETNSLQKVTSSVIEKKQKLRPSTTPPSFLASSTLQPPVYLRAPATAAAAAAAVESISQESLNTKTPTSEQLLLTNKFEYNQQKIIDKNLPTQINEKTLTLSSGMIKITYPKDINETSNTNRISIQNAAQIQQPLFNNIYKAIDLNRINENLESSASASASSPPPPPPPQQQPPIMLRNNLNSQSGHLISSTTTKPPPQTTTTTATTTTNAKIGKTIQTNQKVSSVLIRRDYDNNTFDNVSIGKSSEIEIAASSGYRYKSKILVRSPNNSNSSIKTNSNQKPTIIDEQISTIKIMSPTNNRLNLPQDQQQQNKQPTQNEIKKCVKNIFKKITKKTSITSSTLEKLPNINVEPNKDTIQPYLQSSERTPTTITPPQSPSKVIDRTEILLKTNKRLKKSHSATLYEQQAALSQLNQLGIVNSTNSVNNLNNCLTTTAVASAIETSTTTTTTTTATTTTATRTMTNSTTPAMIPAIINQISNQIDENINDNCDATRNESINIQKQSNIQKFFRLGSYKNLKNRIGPSVIPFRFRNRNHCDRTKIKSTKLLKQKHRLLKKKLLQPSKLCLLSSGVSPTTIVSPEITAKPVTATKTTTTTTRTSSPQLQSSILLKLHKLPSIYSSPLSVTTKSPLSQQESLINTPLTTQSTSNEHYNVVNLNKVHDHTYHFVSSHAIDSTTSIKTNIIHNHNVSVPGNRNKQNNIEQTLSNSPNFDDCLYSTNLLDRNSMASSTIVSSTTRIIPLNTNNSTDDDESALTASGGNIIGQIFDQIVNSTEIDDNNSILPDAALEIELNLPLLEKCIKINPIEPSVTVAATAAVVAASPATTTTPTKTIVTDTTPSLSAINTINTKTTSPIPRQHLLLNSNPLKCDMGPVLAALYTNNTIIIVQELEISFWKYPCRIYSIFGMPQQWELLGCSKRDTSDIEIDTPYQNRLCSFGSGISVGGGSGGEQRPAYVEFRAKQLLPTETRECYLSSIYLNIYFINEKTLEPIVNHVDLDKIMGMANSVRYTVLTNSRYFVMSWMEQAINRSRTGICKYSLSPEFDTWDNVQEFPFLQHSLNSLMCFEENNLLGFGYSVVTMWDHRTGDLILNIDIDLPIGNNLGCFMANENENENGDRYMFLAQYFNGTISNNGDCVNSATTQYLKLMAINLTDCFSWKVIQTHELPSNFDCAISTSISMDNLTVTFRNGESLLLNLYNPRMIYLRNNNSFLKHQQQEQQQQQLFVQNDKIFQIMENQIYIKTTYEHFLESNNNSALH